MGVIMDTCSDCIFYEQINGKGYCKVAHPCISPTQAGIDGQWPMVDGSAKPCGEFAKE
jgi:hypothetical protein